MRILSIVLTFLFCNHIYAGLELSNVTSSKFLKRKERTLIFSGSGIQKFVCGIAIPVLLEDATRSLGAIFTIDGGFDVPTKASFWWNKWDGRTLADAKRQYNKDGTYVRDESRQFVYDLIETYLNRQGRHGRQCLLRAICEHARVDIGEGIIDQIIFTVLRPSDDSDDEYRQAYAAGKYGAICIAMYPECPMGQGLLDGLYITKDSRYFKDWKN